MKPRKKAGKSIDTNLVTKADLHELEYRLTIKLGGMLVVGISIVTALVKVVH